MRSSYRIVDFLRLPRGKIITEGTFDWFPPRNDPPEARKRETVFVINDLLPFSRCFVKREWIFVISTCHANSSWWKVKEQRKSLSLIGCKYKKELPVGHLLYKIFKVKTCRDRTILGNDAVYWEVWVTW